MNTKTCKECPAVYDFKELDELGIPKMECRRDPPQVYTGPSPHFPDMPFFQYPPVHPDFWCYRGREIMEEEDQKKQWLEQRKKDQEKQIEELKRLLWTKKSPDGRALTGEDLKGVQELLDHYESTPVETDIGVPAHFSPMYPKW